MTVGDLQKCMTAIAEAAGPPSGPLKSLAGAAAALKPFAGYTIERFEKFLRAAEEKYGADETLPDAKPSKAEKSPKPTAAALATRINELMAAIGRGGAMDRPAVTAEVFKFEKLTQPDIDGVMAGLQFPGKVKPKAKALEAIVTHILAEQTATDRNKI